MEYISYNTGTRALPDIYALALGRGAARPRASCVYIRQSTLACVITITYIYIYIYIYEIEHLITITEKAWGIAAALATCITR